MTNKVPSVKLNDGSSMPVLGLGTYLAKKGECEQAVKDAIDAGYRHIDTAYVYGNEGEVGNAVRAKIDEGVVKREDMYIVTKLGNHHHLPEQVRPAAQKSMDTLDLGPIDLYLMHTPMGYNPDTTDYVDTWKAMESLVKEGLVRSLGVSNFNSEQLTRLLEVATIKPVTNQVECSPNLSQPKLREFCALHEIVLTAYGPLTRPHRTAAGQQSALVDPIVLLLAEQHGKTAAQICLKFLIQIGTVPIPKSTNKTRIHENIGLFDFDLSDQDMAKMHQLNINLRMCPFTPDLGHKYFPFDAEF